LQPFTSVGSAAAQVGATTSVLTRPNAIGLHRWAMRRWQ